jgi:hypothetical protein
MDVTPDKTPWAKVLYTLAAVALVYWIFFYKPDEALTTEIQSAVPGWDDLIPCSDMVSFDGTKTLTLYEDHRTSVYYKDPLKEPKEGERGVTVEGTWSFDEISKRYSVTLNGLTTDYLMLSPEDVSTCMLIKGDLEAADLRGSWFSKSDEPESDEPEPDPGP